MFWGSFGIARGIFPRHLNQQSPQGVFQALQAYRRTPNCSRGSSAGRQITGQFLQNANKGHLFPPSVTDEHIVWMETYHRGCKFLGKASAICVGWESTDMNAEIGFFKHSFHFGRRRGDAHIHTPELVARFVQDRFGEWCHKSLTTSIELYQTSESMRLTGSAASLKISWTVSVSPNRWVRASTRTHGFLAELIS